MTKLSLRAKYMLASLLPAAATLLVWAVGSFLTRRSTGGEYAGVVLAAAMVVSAITAAVLAAFLSENLSKRIRTLIGAADLISSGLAIRSDESSRDELGQLAFAMVRMSRQVNEEKAELIESNSRVEAVLRATSEVSILAEDLSGRITICNTGAERLLGYRPGELSGRHLNEVVHTGADAQQRTSLQAARYKARRDAPEELENIYVRRDGLSLEVHLSVTPLKDRKGQTVGFLHVAHDISPRKVLESELRQKNEQLKSQSQAFAAATEAKAASLTRLHQAAIEPLSSVQRSLLALRDSLKNDEDVQVVNRCRILTESALDAVRQTAGSKKQLSVADSKHGLPEFVSRPSSERRTGGKQPLATLDRVDDWYEEQGEIPSSRSRPFRREKLLIVDDFEATRALMRAYLKDLNYDLDFAADGEEALEKVAAESYRLVLMDIEMPKMNGHETARRIRAWEDEQSRTRLPLIAMTANAVADFDPADAALWSSSLSKPLSKAKLNRELEKFLNPA